MLFVPKGYLRADDDGAERRKRLAEALKRGEQISVAPSGEVMTESEKNDNPDAVSITVPEGKLAIYTVYSCGKCHHYYKSWHSGICPNCSGKLNAEAVNESFYNSALS